MPDPKKKPTGDFSHADAKYKRCPKCGDHFQVGQIQILGIKTYDVPLSTCKCADIKPLTYPRKRGRVR